ncbi:hypothetical protein BJ742DRAFT_781429 [Cladochytrium replicatum]|nr:hypothetical protein BJ742DRAFT_781429 [Cladochytrium replicatum]
MHKACTTWGAFVATNHWLDEAVMRKVLSESRKYFELSAEEREKLHVRNGSIAWSGYMPKGGEKTQPAVKSALYVGSEHWWDHPRVQIIDSA